MKAICTNYGRDLRDRYQEESKSKSNRVCEKNEKSSEESQDSIEKSIERE